MKPISAHDPVTFFGYKISDDIAVF